MPSLDRSTPLQHARAVGALTGGARMLPMH
jgi:hypothetical protein